MVRETGTAGLVAFRTAFLTARATLALAFALPAAANGPVPSQEAVITVHNCPEGAYYLELLMPEYMKDITALIVAGCAFLFLFVLKLACRIVDPNCFEPKAPFLDIKRFGMRQIQYIFTAGIQEFLARSVIQRNLKRITVGKHPATVAIFLSSLIFAALHIHFGFLFMFGAAILAGLEGILYEKQQNILGVWIVHWVFGVSGTLLCLIDH